MLFKDLFLFFYVLLLRIIPEERTFSLLAWKPEKKERSCLQDMNHHFINIMERKNIIISVVSTMPVVVAEFDNFKIKYEEVIG